MQTNQQPINTPTTTTTTTTINNQLNCTVNPTIYQSTNPIYATINTYVRTTSGSLNHASAPCSRHAAANERLATQQPAQHNAQHPSTGPSSAATLPRWQHNSELCGGQQCSSGGGGQHQSRTLPKCAGCSIKCGQYKYAEG